MCFFQAIISSIGSYSPGTPAPPTSEPLKVLVVGDSIANGTSETYLSDTEFSTGNANPDTLFEWNGAQLVEVVNDTEEALDGSMYPALANKFKELTGKKVYLVETAVGGSEFAFNGDTNNWTETQGILYGNMRTKADSFVAEYGMFDVIIMTLGINDSKAGVTEADFHAAADSLFARLHTDFPNVPTVMNKIDAFGQSYLMIRLKMNDIVANDPLVHFGKDFNSLPSEAFFDGVHLYQTWNNSVGEDVASTVKTVLGL